jgi:uncharacterized repeat protein (TIGR02543 family)
MRQVYKSLTLALLLVGATAAIWSASPTPTSTPPEPDAPVASPNLINPIDDHPHADVASAELSTAPISYANPALSNTPTREVSGTLSYAIADARPGETLEAETYYFLLTDDEYLQVAFDDAFATNLPAESTFTGSITDNSDVAAATITPIVAEASAPTKRTHYIDLVIYNDATTPDGTVSATGYPRPVINTTAATALINNLKSYYVAETRGYIQDIQIANTKVVNNVTSSASICPTSTTGSTYYTNMSNLAAQQLGFATYNNWSSQYYGQSRHLVVFLPEACNRIDWAGLALVGSFTASNWLFVQNCCGAVDSSYGFNNTNNSSKGSYNVSTFAHEFGHNLGFQHASSQIYGSTANTCQNTTATCEEYGNGYSIMGSGWNYELPALDTAYKDVLGVANGEFYTLSTADINSINTAYTISATGSAAGTKTGLKISTGLNDAYYIELRNGALSTETYTKYGLAPTYPNKNSGLYGDNCIIPSAIVYRATNLSYNQPHIFLSTKTTKATYPYGTSGATCYSPSWDTYILPDGVKLNLSISGNQLTVAPLFNVALDSNGGSAVTQKTDIPAGSAIGTLPTPTRSNHTFKGWFTKSIGGSKISSTTTISQLTYYAQWWSPTISLPTPTPIFVAATPPYAIKDIASYSTEQCEAMTWVVRAGLSIDTVNNAYNPDSPVRREAMALFMYRLAGKPDQAQYSNPLPIGEPVDISSLSSEQKQAIRWLVDNGISKPGADKKFNPANTVTREAMALFMFRLTGSLDNSRLYSIPGEFDSADINSAYSNEEKIAIRWMINAGISKPDQYNKLFNPKNIVKRESMALFLKRTFDIVYNHI